MIAELTEFSQNVSEYMRRRTNKDGRKWFKRSIHPELVILNALHEIHPEGLTVVKLAEIVESRSLTFRSIRVLRKEQFIESKEIVTHQSVCNSRVKVYLSEDGLILCNFLKPKKTIL